MSVVQFTCNGSFFNIVLPPHGKAHEWINGVRRDDAVNVHPRMFAYLRTTTIEDTVLVNVTPLVYRNGSSFVTFVGDKVNLTSYIPSTTNRARLVLIGLNTSTNTLQVIQGTEGIDNSETPLSIPTGMANNFIPSALVKLRTGDLALTEDRITDARVFLNPNTSGGGEAATQLEVDTGTNDTKFVTPETLKNVPVDHFAGVTKIVADDGSPIWEIDGSDKLVNVGSSKLDLNGADDGLILDADSDTTISSPTNNQIDVAIGGVDTVRINNNGINLLNSGDDYFAEGDVYSLFDRLVNWGFNPDEHWRNNTDELSWTGWASYTGFVTPAIIATTNSIYRVAHNASARAFRYRAAATGGQIYLRARVSLTYIVSVGLMIDDGVNNADGNGANNFYRAYITQSAIGGNINGVEQFRSGGGAVTTNTTTFAYPPGPFVGIGLNTTGTLWSSWGAFPFVFGEAGERIQYTNGTGLAFSWTPARVGLYCVFTAVDGNRKALFDWYDEATS